MSDKRHPAPPDSARSHSVAHAESQADRRFCADQWPRPRDRFRRRRVASERTAVAAALRVAGLWEEREGADANPVGRDHDDAAGEERLLELRQVGAE
jgi:hypothetical protein